MIQTHSYAEALDWAHDIAGSPNAVEIWIPQAGFVAAHRSVGGLSVTRNDNGVFGMGIGPSPYIDPSWTRMALPRDLPAELVAAFTPTSSVDTMTQSTSFAPLRAVGVEQTDMQEIHTLLQLHAPDTGIHADLTDKRFWYGMRDGRRLAAIASLSTWESGHTMLASVATHREYRGKGLATQLAKDALYYARRRQAPSVSLLVGASNKSAIYAYTSAGYRRIAAFTIYEPRPHALRPTDYDRLDPL